MDRLSRITTSSHEDFGHTLESSRGGTKAHLTEADNVRIRRKTDAVILTLLVWVYFLQILDKTTLGYAAIFGLQKDTHLSGLQYSMLGSIAPIAQLCWQPFSSVLIVKIPWRILMPMLVLGWGIAQSSLAACNSYSGLMAARFFLGLFEAGCLPLFTLITAQWYRRSEQPTRVAAWYGTNGIATCVAAALSYGLGHIKSSVLHSWQIIFLFCGLITVATTPIVYWRLENDVPTARFLSPIERQQAIQRLEVNQTGTTNSQKFKWKHVLELASEPKTYLFIGMALLLNLAAQVSNVFGPLILSGLGFDKYKTSLLNIPFGALQFIAILIGSWAAQKARLKSAVLAASMIPVIAGVVILYVLPRKKSNTAALLAGFYLFAFLFAGIPLILSWLAGNTAGTTKKSVMVALYQAAASSGNIIGPYLFKTEDAPSYHPGLRAVLGILVAFVVLVGLQVLNFRILNGKKRERRKKAGKQPVSKDWSMEAKLQQVGCEDRSWTVTQERSLMDLTDRENDDFIFIY